MKQVFLDLAAIHNPIRAELDQAYQRVQDSGWYVLGQEVEAFEAEYARVEQVEHCISTGNGLDALALLLQACDIGAGDEVIVPAHTFIATWLAVSRSGATIVPVEPDPVTYNIDPQCIEQAITQNTRAIMPVNLYGQPAALDAINILASQHGLLVLLDAAQSQGALLNGKPVASLCHAAATSFYPGKNLGALGDGGAVLTRDAELAQRIHTLRNYGSTKKYQHEALGVNSRLDELQAAFLRVKLKHLSQWNQQRRQIAKWYGEALQASHLTLPKPSADMSPVWHLYVVRSLQRNALHTYLAEHGIATQIHYPIPPHQQPCYAQQDWSSYPITEQMSKEILSLPMYPGMTQQQVSFIADTILHGGF